MSLPKTDELDKTIIKVLKEADGPLSTTDIARLTRSSWHPVMRACLCLAYSGEIRTFQAGRMRLWSLARTSR